MLSKKRQRNSLSKNVKTKMITNISLSQVQDDFSKIERMNFAKNKYCLRSEPISITTHRTPTKKLNNKETTKSNKSKEISIATKNKKNKKINVILQNQPEVKTQIMTRSKTPMVTRSKTEKIKRWKKYSLFNQK